MESTQARAPAPPAAALRPGPQRLPDAASRITSALAFRYSAPGEARGRRRAGCLGAAAADRDGEPSQSAATGQPAAAPVDDCPSADNADATDNGSSGEGYFATLARLLRGPRVSSGGGGAAWAARPNPVALLLAGLFWLFDTLTCSRLPSSKLLRALLPHGGDHASPLLAGGALREGSVHLEAFKLKAASDIAVLLTQAAGHAACALAYAWAATSSSDAVFLAAHAAFCAACAGLATTFARQAGRLELWEQRQRAFRTTPDPIRGDSGKGGGGATAARSDEGDSRHGDSSLMPSLHPTSPQTAPPHDASEAPAADAGVGSVDGSGTHRRSATAASERSGAGGGLDPYTTSALARLEGGLEREFPFITRGWLSLALTALMVATNALLCASLAAETLDGPYGDRFGRAGSRADALSGALLVGGSALIAFVCAAEYSSTFAHAAVGITAIFATSLGAVTVLWGLPLPHASSGAGRAAVTAMASRAAAAALLGGDTAAAGSLLLRAGTSRSHVVVLHLLLGLAWYLCIMSAFERNLQLRLITIRYSRMEEGVAHRVRRHEAQLDALEAQLEAQATLLIERYMGGFTGRLRDSVHAITALVEELLARNAAAAARPPAGRQQQQLLRGGSQSAASPAAAAAAAAAAESDDLTDVLNQALRVKRLLESWDGDTLKRRLHARLLPTLQHVKSLMESDLPGVRQQPQLRRPAAATDKPRLSPPQPSGTGSAVTVTDSDHRPYRHDVRVGAPKAPCTSAAAPADNGAPPPAGDGAASDAAASAASTGGDDYGPGGLHQQLQSQQPHHRLHHHGGIHGGDGGGGGGRGRTLHHLHLPEHRLRRTSSEPASSPPPDSLGVWTPSDRWGSGVRTPASASSPHWLLERAAHDLALSDRDLALLDEQLPSSSGLSLSVEPLRVGGSNDGGSGREAHTQPLPPLPPSREAATDRGSGAVSGVAKSLAAAREGGSDERGGGDGSAHTERPPLAAPPAPSVVARLQKRLLPLPWSRRGTAGVGSPSWRWQQQHQQQPSLRRDRAVSPPHAAFPTIAEALVEPLSSATSPPLSSSGLAAVVVTRGGGGGGGGFPVRLPPSPVHDIAAGATPPLAAPADRLVSPPALHVPSPQSLRSRGYASIARSSRSLSLSPTSSAGYETGGESIGLPGVHSYKDLPFAAALAAQSTAAASAAAAHPLEAVVSSASSSSSGSSSHATSSPMYSPAGLALIGDGNPPHGLVGARTLVSAVPSDGGGGGTTAPRWESSRASVRTLSGGGGAPGSSPSLAAASAAPSSPSAALPQWPRQEPSTPYADATAGGVGGDGTPSPLTIQAQPLQAVQQTPYATAPGSATAYSQSDDDATNDDYGGGVGGVGGGSDLGGGGGSGLASGPHRPGESRLEREYLHEYGWEHEYRRRGGGAAGGGAGLGGVGISGGGGLQPLQPPLNPYAPAAVAAAAAAAAAATASSSDDGGVVGVDGSGTSTIADTLVAAGISLQPTIVHGALTDASAVILGATGLAPVPVPPPEGDGGSASTLAAAAAKLTSSESDAEEGRPPAGGAGGGAGGALLPSQAAAAAAAATTSITASLPSMQAPPLGLPPLGGGGGRGLGTVAGAVGSATGGGGGVAADREFKFGLHVLVVDDERVNRKVTSRMLEKLGCSCDAVEDGDEIVSALVTSERPFDAILLDIIMRRTNGLEVCRALRDQHVDVPIIAATANFAPREAALYRAAGFTSVLTKPFSKKDLAAALTQALGVHLAKSS